MPNSPRPFPHERGVARLESRKKLASAGFTASVWTISGVVLAACSSTIEDIEKFLGLDDGGDGGGNALHVQRSPVQGARLYFDMDNDGDIDADDISVQDAAFPKGFVTDSTGRAHNIPAIFHGLPFKAVLDGAIDADTGDSLSGALHSIPDANGYHRLASPITDLIARDGRPLETVVAELLNNNANDEEIARILEAINNPRNYLGGDEGIEALAFYIASLPTPPDADAVQSHAEKYLTDDPTDLTRDTLIIVNADADSDPRFIDFPAKSIGAHDSYVAKIQAMSHAGGVRYRFVEADGTPADVSDFNIDSQGIISFIGANPTTTTLHIEVSNGTPSESEIVRVEITVAPAPTVDELPAGAEFTTIMEGVAGAGGTGTALIEGITTSATNPTWAISEVHPAGLDDILDKFEIVAGSGITYNLVLKDGESLDYEAIPRGVLNLHVWAQENDVRSNPLALRIRVEQDPDEVAFSGSFTGIVAEDGNGIARGRVSVENHPENAVVSVSNQGTYGTLTLDGNGAWTYTLDGGIARVNGLRDGQVLLDVVELSIGTSAVSQNIIIRINGADEDVHFTNADNARTTDASVDIEFGNPVLSGVDIFDRLNLMNATRADIEINFADTGGVYDLFTITNSGLLTFIGTNEDVADFGSVVTLNLQITAPTLTTATLRFALQVNVINMVDDGRTAYEIIGDVAVGQLLRVQEVQGSTDPDGVIGDVGFQWFRGDERNPTLLRAGETYRVTQADIDSGDSIGVFVSYTDGSGVTYTHRDNDVATTITAFATPVKFTSPDINARTINLAEDTNADNTPRFNVQAESKDDNGNTIGVANYMLVRDNGDIDTTDKGFEIDPDSGAITLTGALDYEMGTSITLRVRATDTNNPPETATLTLTINVDDVNDHKPIFVTEADDPTLNYTPDPIAESARLGTEIARVRATDADGTAAHNMVSYDITAGDPNDVFFIDSNGIITLIKPLDYDTTPRYTLEITATDGSLTDTAMVTVTVTDINDESPTVPNHVATGTARITAAADNPSSGSGTSMNYTVTVSDADADATTLDVSITAGDPRFEFQRQGNTNTWELYLVAGQEIALSELNDQLTFEYRVTDGGVGTTPATGSFVLTVVDTPVEFATPTAADLDFAENEGGERLTISATSSDDTNPSVAITSYMFVYRDQQGQEQVVSDYQGFSINNQGVITLTGGTALDYETASSHHLRIQATDANNEVGFLPITVIVNDVEEGEANYIVAGNVQPMATLTAQLASAADEDPDGRVGAVTYRWFVRDAADADPTSITDTNSAITWLTDASSAADANEFTLPNTLESGGVYGVAISYLDGFADGSTPRGDATFQVELASAVEFLDADSNVLTDSTYRPDPIAENTDNLLTVTARLESATFRYSITSGNDEGIFEIGPSNGAISVVSGKTLDFEAGDQRTLTIRADEVGGDNAFGFATVIIRVSDVNEFKPVFVTNAEDSQLLDNSVDIEVAENAADGATVGLFRATDADGSNNDVSYTLTGGGGVFDVREVTGTNNWEIYVADNTNLNFDGSTKNYNLMITASDSDPDNAMSSDAEAFNIAITDINDNAPTMTTSGTATLTEEVAGVAGGTETGFSITLADKDTDAVNNHAITVTGDLASRFGFVKDGTTANQWNLVLLAGQEVDSETDGTQLTIEYQVTDGAKYTSPTESVDVAIIDTNDHSPTINLAGDMTIDERTSDNAGNPIIADLTISLSDDDATAAYQSGQNTDAVTFTVFDTDGSTVRNDFSVIRPDNTKNEYQLQYTGTEANLDAIATNGTLTLNLGISDRDPNTNTTEQWEFTLTINNLDEGDARYEIMGVVGEGARLEAMLVVGGEDPDGVDGTVDVMYRWFTKSSADPNPTSFEDSGSGDFQWLAPQSTTNTYTITGVPVAGADYGVLVSYKDSSVGDALSFTSALALTLEFGESSYSGSIKENGMNLTTIDIDATLDSSADDITYAFVTDASTGATATTHQGFAINATDGTITFTGTASTYLDYESITDNPIPLIVRATHDNGDSILPNPFSDVDVAIAVEDVNDHGPTVAVAGTGTIDERTTGNTIAISARGLTITLADDDGTNAQKSGVGLTPNFRVLNAADDMENTDYQVVDLDGLGTWTLQLRAGSALDREEPTPTIALKIEVSDGVHTPDVSDAFTLSVNNVDEGRARFFIDGSAGGMLSAELESDGADPDGVNGDYSYKWFTATDQSETRNYISGEISKTFTTANHPLEAGEIYGVEVSYTDNAGTRYEGDTAPVALAEALRFTSSYSIMLTDGNANPTLPVFALELNSVVFTDATYSFDTDGNPGGFFALTKAGVLTLDRAVDFDTATDTSFTLKVKATASSGEATMAKIPVTVIDTNDSNPSITAADDTRMATGSLVDDVADGDPGVSFKIVDADSNAVNRFDSDITSTSHPLLADRFTLIFDTTDPAAKTAKLALKPNMKIDREELGNTDTISLNVKVTDGQATSAEGVVVTITITDVNDNAPTVTTSNTASLTEEVAGVAGGTKTGFSITLDDKDSANNHDFTILGGEDNRFDFVKDGTTPNLWHLVLLEGQKVDREADGASIALDFQVTDDANTPITYLVDVNIIDTNDKAPTVAVAGTGTIDERIFGNTNAISAAGLTITIADADATNTYKSGIGLTPQFRVLNAADDTENTNFEVVDVDGLGTWTLRLKTGSTLNFEEPTASIALKIEVRDGVNTPDVSDAFTLNVVNLDEGKATYIIDGTFAADETLTVMRSTPDPDGIAVAASYQWFTTSDGGITKTDAPGTSDKETYTLPSTLADGVGYGVTITYTDAVVGALPTVIDVLTSSLSFADNAPVVEVPENLGAGGAVATVTASLDGEPGATVTYEFAANGNPDNLFAISGSGAITLVAADSLDFDTDPKSYKITIKASAQDADDKTQIATAVVTVNLTDIDDEAPALSAAQGGTPQGTGSITENDRGADTGISFTLTDADTPISTTATPHRFNGY